MGRAIQQFFFKTAFFRPSLAIAPDPRRCYLHPRANAGIMMGLRVRGCKKNIDIQREDREDFMGELIASLQRLQEIELELNRIRKGEEAKLRQISGASRKIVRLDDDLLDLGRTSDQLQRESNALELEVKTREAAVTKHREELLKARTNKDYATILTAINTEKADTSKIEQLALEKLTEVEGFQAQITTREEEKSGIQARQDKVQAALDAYRAETADERERLEQSRKEASTTLPASALSTFTRVADHHEGEALAEVLKIHPKREEYACGGCNMQIPLDSVNTLRSRDEIRFCASCGRIHYLADTQVVRA